MSDLPGGFPVGALVALDGMTEKAEAVEGILDSDAQSMDFNGSQAQLLEWKAEEEKWICVTFNGCVIGVKPQFCRLLTADELEGYNLVVGPRVEVERLVPRMSAVLVDHGFLVMNIILSDAFRVQMFDVAKALEEDGMFSRLPAGFEAGYLGRDGKGKTVLIDTSAADTPFSVLNSPLPAQDQNISILSQLLQPYMQDNFGFDIYSRTSLMLRMPFAGLEDEAKYPAPIAPAKEMDAFMSTMGRKRMCVLHFLGPASGELTLLPKFEEVPEIILAAKPNTMVMFLTDQYDYTYVSEGECLTLQSWFLDRPLVFKQIGVNGTLEALAKPKQDDSAPPPLSDGAVVFSGLASRDPCCADEHEKFWAALRHAGCDGFLEIPHERFDIDQYIEYEDQSKALREGKSYCRHQGQVEGIEIFDAGFFSIPETEVYGMDPEQRIVLETAWLAMGSAGYDVKKLKRDSAHVGCFVGISSSDWRDVCQAPSANGVPETFIANRFSYAVNLKGPSTIVNTACSASLVATHAAKLHLSFRHDPLEACVCVGVSLNTSPGTWIGNCSGQMLSFLGRSYTFNSTADGYGRGEGAAGFVIKLGEYSVDADNVYAALAGSHSNSDGRSASLTAPNGPAQQRLLRAVLSETGLQQPEIDVYEAHGTGTSLGDPIEVGAVKKVQVQRPRTSPILISCSKTNLGHLEGGAGASALCKCILAAMHNECCPNQHLREQNPHLDMEGFPALLLAEPLPFRAEAAYVGVSGFGYGGTNAHCLAYGRNVCTTRATGQKMSEAAFVRKINAAPPPDIWTEGDTYEDWTTTGMPHVGVSEGKSYQVELTATGKAVWRETVVPDLAESGCSYFIQGSSNDWEMSEMQASESVAGLYSIEITIGPSGEETFQIAVDMDDDLVLYPEKPRCTKKSAKIRGPEPAPSQEDAWLIRGDSGTRYTIELFKPSAATTSVTWLRSTS